MNIKGCKALITGGSKGIGFAIAEAMKKMGANIAITGRNYRSLSEAARKIDAVPFISDVRSEAECKRAVIKAVNALGSLDVLINNAAVSHHSPVESLEVKPFHNVWQTNVVGPMVMTREVIPLFKKQQHGTIINIASTAALHGYENATAYVASKFALRGMTQCWQAELRRFNIRVILINPSEVQTNFGKKSKPSLLNPKKLHPEDIAHAVVSCLLMDCRGFIPEATIYATNPW